MKFEGVMVSLLSAIAAATITMLLKKNRATSATNVANLTATSDSISSVDSESTANITNKTSTIDCFSSADLEQVAIKRSYEVFLSFCGEDTRNQFTDFLYTHLRSASIQTFRDNEELRVGEEIGPELLKAIKESKISIPILSENYASSKWCLLELAEMVDCHTNGEHMIYPIFYGVNPSDVRNQRGSYELAFREHEKKYDVETVKKWMGALKTVGELKGLELKKETNGREGELVKMVTEKVVVTLKKNYTILPKNLVGIDKSVEILKALLKVDSGGVRIVGIHGMGGLGKTTIAKAAYNELCDNFEHHYFLNDVRENPSSKIQLITNGRGSIEDTVSGRKVLLVLDDVDNYSQIDMLMGSHSWYGANSRIIITTRDTKVLCAIKETCQKEGSQDVYASYEPDYMSEDDSLQLFSKYAFMRDSPVEGFESFSKEVVSIAAGLPLVLVVLGSTFFTEKDISFWEAKLKMCRMTPEKEVFEKLKVSFDTLNNEQRRIFLDVACFFIGIDVRRASYMWDDCECFPQVGIRVLISKSLITVDDRNIVHMHDQLRDLGREIVRGEGLIDLGSRSRLWRIQDSFNILNSSQVAKNVEALSLSFRDSIDKPYDGSLSPSSFRIMPNLRYLRVEYLDIEGDFHNLFSNLRWLHLSYLGKFMPTNLQLKNLVILHLSSWAQSRQCKEDWQQGLMNQLNMGTKLKVLDLSGCKSLRSLPHLSVYTSLEILDLSECIAIRRLDGLEQLKSLKYLDASRCVNLGTLPNLSNLTNLVGLYLDCEKIDEIKGLGKLESLEYLRITDCASLKILPDLSNLKRLKRLDLYRNYKLIIEVDGLNQLNALEVLHLEYCGSLKGILDMSNMCNLIEVCASKLEVSNIVNSKLLQNMVISFSDVPIEFRGLDALRYLNVAGGSMKRLQDLSCLRSLKKLYITYSNELITIEDIGELESLEILRIASCQSIVTLLFLSNFRKLQDLSIEFCDKLTGIQGLDRLESLKVIKISYCGSLERFHGHAINESLERLVIEGCWNLREISDLQSFKNLRILLMYYLEKLTKIDGLQEVKFLEQFVCGGCTSVAELPDFTKLEKLRLLCAADCLNLRDIKGLEELKSLECLIHSGCHRLVDPSYFPNTKVLSASSYQLFGGRSIFPFVREEDPLEYYNREWSNLTGSQLSGSMDSTD